MIPANVQEYLVIAAVILAALVWIGLRIRARRKASSCANCPLEPRRD